MIKMWNKKELHFKEINLEIRDAENLNFCLFING